MAAAAFSWLQFLWPPVQYWADHHDKGLAPLLGELLKPTNEIYPGRIPLLGYAFLAVTAVLILFAIAIMRAVGDYLEHSRVGISVLNTTLDVEMQDAARTKCIVRREQTFHANRRGITAYHLASRPDSPAGEIDVAATTYRSHVGNRAITKELLKRGSSKNLDMIEVFTKELPTSLICTFLPNWLVYMLHGAGLFHEIVVTRHGQIHFDNEFTGNDGVFSIQSTKFPITRVTIRISFLKGHAPPPDQIRAFLIRENVVEEVAMTETQNGHGTHVTFEAKANSLYLESLRVQWTF